MSARKSSEAASAAQRRLLKNSNFLLLPASCGGVSSTQRARPDRLVLASGSQTGSHSWLGASSSRYRLEAPDCRDAR
eukprot:scaffold53382_cov28-Tisochrysis_lutea.AAC.3